MKNRSLSVLSRSVAIGLALGCPAALAEDMVPGLYFSGAIGANYLDNITVDILDGTGFRQDRLLNFDNGYAALLALGIRLSPMLRVEGELSFRSNDLDQLTVQNEGPRAGAGGEATAFAVMLNGWLDIPASDIVTPYIGGGVGGASVAIDAGAPGIGCLFCRFDGRGFVFAWQLGAGVAVGSPGGPQLTIDFRLFNADGIGVSTGEIFPGATSDYNAQSIMIGFRMPIGASN